MKNEQNKMVEISIQDISPTQITQAYKGRSGCACGCRGTHWYASRVAEQANKDRGYAIKVNDKKIVEILRTLQAHEDLVEFDGSLAAADIDGKLLIVYLNSVSA